MNCCQMTGILRRKKPNTKADFKKDALFRQLLEWYTTRPDVTAKPIEVRVRKLPNGLLGSCRLLKDKFLIELSAEMGVEQACDVFVHEVAHAIAWNCHHSKVIDERADRGHIEWVTHDEAWGCAYSQAYRMYTECRDIVGYKKAAEKLTKKHGYKKPLVKT